MCTSIEDLQDHVRHEIESKASPTRAEYLSAVFELRSDVVFHLVDDASASAPPTADGAEGPRPGAAPTAVTVADVATRQSLDDPTLQQSVARHVADALGAVDGCVWCITAVTRASQGWTFTYVCRESHQAWNRQHAKHVAKVVPAEHTVYAPNERPDPILMGKC